MGSWPSRILAILLTLTSLLVSVPATAAVAGPTLISLTLNPTTVTGGAPSQVLGVTPKLGQVIGTITLSGSAPLGVRGLAISLSSNNPAVATVPTSVMVPAGATSASFTVTTQPVTSQTSITISAFYGGVTRTATLTVVPPVLSFFSCIPASVTGGTPANCTVALTGPAYSGGVNITLDSSNPAVAQPSLLHIPLPLALGKGIVTVAAGHTSATFTVQTKPVPSQTSVTISASFGGATKTAALTVLPPALTSLTLNPTSVTACSPSTGTVTLTGPAYSGGVTIALSSSNPSVAPVPTSLVVPAGQAWANFTLPTNPVTSQTSVTIGASYGGVTKTATLTVVPLVLKNLTLNPTSVTGGASSTGTVTLTGPACSGGAVVSLSSSNPAVASVSASVTVAAGQNSATFTVTTNPVTSQTSVTIAASYGGVTKTATLTVNPVVKADLSIQSWTYKDSLGNFVEPSVNYRWAICPTVVNSLQAPGTAAASTLQISISSSPQESGYPINWPVSVPALAPGATKEVCGPQLTTNSGHQYTFNMCADYYNVVSELSENNNCSTWQIKFP